jgi:hypothetical protein
MKSPKEQRSEVLDAIINAYRQGYSDSMQGKIGCAPETAKKIMDRLTGHCAADEAKSCFNCSETCKCECLGCTMAKTT